MNIPRNYHRIANHLEKGKVLVLYGPRQVGKTTLVEKFLSKTSLTYKLDTGDNLSVQHLFASRDFNTILEYAKGYQLLVIDEAQRIPYIGEGLKILVDHNKELQILVTGSSSFELAGQIGEPLTGRKNTLTLYPIAQLELKSMLNGVEMKENLEKSLLFGGYPDIVVEEEKREKIRKLEELVNAYLFKDILELENIKNSKTMVDLVRLLAFQIGNEVSLLELGKQLGKDRKTVAKYIDLLEKSFVIFEQRGYSRNLRKEITKKSKYYFYDLGIRNAVIANFNPLEIRNDKGELWENFIVLERLKKRTYMQIMANSYFWRSWSKQEVDLVEEREGKLFGYECKWKEKKLSPPTEWKKNYPEATFEIIHTQKYLSFIA